jgi:hypothetical protein
MVFNFMVCISFCENLEQVASASSAMLHVHFIFMTAVTEVFLKLQAWNVNPTHLDDPF